MRPHVSLAAVPALDTAPQPRYVRRPAMDYRLLGTVEVSDAGRAIPLGRGKVRALLALLLLHAGEPVSTDRLVEALWGDVHPRDFCGESE